MVVSALKSGRLERFQLSLQLDQELLSHLEKVLQAEVTGMHDLRAEVRNRTFDQVDQLQTFLVRERQRRHWSSLLPNPFGHKTRKHRGGEKASFFIIIIPTF